MDWNNIEKSWIEFCENHNLKLLDYEKQLFPQMDKVKEYKTVEISNKFKLYFHYKFYMGDVLQLANYFHIIVPVSSKVNFRISPNSFIKKVIKKEKLLIVSENIPSDYFENFHQYFSDFYKQFPDLVIRLGELEKGNSSIESGFGLQVITKKYLPETASGIEQFRLLVNELLDRFQTIITPIENKEMDFN